MPSMLASVLALIISLTGLCGLARSEDTENTRDSLRGLKGVYVAVEAMNPALEASGLSRGQIEKAVESQLRQAGIGTWTKQEWALQPGSPFLYVNAHVVRLPDTPEFVYSIGVNFRQNVYPVREAVEIIGASTWAVGVVTGITAEPEKIRNAVETQVEKFITAFRYVNR